MKEFEGQFYEQTDGKNDSKRWEDWNRFMILMSIIFRFDWTIDMAQKTVHRTGHSMKWLLYIFQVWFACKPHTWERTSPCNLKNGIHQLPNLQKIVPFSPSYFNTPDNAWAGFSLTFGWTSTHQLLSFLPEYLNFSADSIQTAKICNNLLKESRPHFHIPLQGPIPLSYKELPLLALFLVLSPCPPQMHSQNPWFNRKSRPINQQCQPNVKREKQLLYNVFKLSYANPCCTELHFLVVCLFLCP